MSLKNYLVIMILTTVSCWISFYYILSSIDPTATNILGFIFFYASLFLALLGTSSLIILGFKLRKNTELLPVFRLVGISFRQGIWISILFSSLLYLQSQNLLSIVNVLGLVFGLVILEFLFLALKNGRH